MCVCVIMTWWWRSYQKESCRFFKSCLMLVLGIVNCADIFVCQLIVFCCFYICFQGCSLIHLDKLYHVSSSPNSLLPSIAGYYCQLLVHSCDWLTVYMCIRVYIFLCESFCSCRQCRIAPVHLHHMLFNCWYCCCPTIYTFDKAFLCTSQLIQTSMESPKLSLKN